MISASIPLKPKGKARPRVTRNGVFMPPDYQQWRADFNNLLFEAVGFQAQIKGAFSLSLTIVTPSGKSRSDLDNIIGAVLDALQDGHWIGNDRDCSAVIAGIGKGKKHEMNIEVRPYVDSGIRGTINGYPNKLLDADGGNTCRQCKINPTHGHLCSPCAVRANQIKIPMRGMKYVDKGDLV